MSAEHCHTICQLEGSPRGAASLFDLDAAAEYSGIHPEMIREFGRAHLVRIAYLSQRADPYFDRDGLGRLRQIQRLRLGRHADLQTIRLITRLLDRIEAAENELATMRTQIH